MNEEAEEFFKIKEEEEENIIDVEEEPTGTCTNCLGTGFKMREENGVLGVVCTSNGGEENSKRLLTCGCSYKMNR